MAADARGDADAAAGAAGAHGEQHSAQKRQRRSPLAGSDSDADAASFGEGGAGAFAQQAPMMERGASGGSAVCPVCALGFATGAGNADINSHVDACLAAAAGAASQELDWA